MKVFDPDPGEFSVLSRRLDTETLGALASRLAGARDVADAEWQTLRLAGLGVLDLVDSPLSKPHSAQSRGQRVMP